MQQHHSKIYVSVLPGRELGMRVRLEGVANLPAGSSSIAAAANVEMCLSVLPG
jgi:hypothetical protein